MPLNGVAWHNDLAMNFHGAKKTTGMSCAAVLAGFAMALIQLCVPAEYRTVLQSADVTGNLRCGWRLDMAKSLSCCAVLQHAFERARRFVNDVAWHSDLMHRHHRCRECFV